MYDIITISESHLHAGIPSNVFALPGFHEIIRKDRGAQGGGVAVFIRDSIQFKRVYEYEKAHLEAIWLRINSIEGKVLLCCCYRPPDKVDFWNDLSDVLNEVKNDQIRNLFILGDLNADFKTANGHKLSQLCISQNLHYLVKEPTRITDNTATVLDQVLTNALRFVKSVVVSPPVSTNDHCTVGIHLNFKVKKESSYKRIIWLYKKANFRDFRQALYNANFDECFEDKDADEACTRWSEPS